MDGNIKAWRAHRALAWLYALVLIGLAAYLHFYPGAPPIPNLFTYAAPLPLLLVFHAVCARGSRLSRPWARIASLAAGFVLLIAFPIGTLFGIYLIAACWQPWPEPFTHAGAPIGGWPKDAVRDRARVAGRR
jgi:chromate transport protein ChrA